MKRFKSNNDVIHAFAQQTYESGECGNLFFEGTKIYSYGRHFLIGEFLAPNVIMINDSYYSATTSRHTTALRMATR